MALITGERSSAERPGPAATCGRRLRDPLVEVAIAAGLDMAGLPAVRAVLDAAIRLRPDMLVIDLAGCSGIDAAAIGLLLDVHWDLLRAGAPLTLRGPTPRLQRILAIARVDQVLHPVPGAAPGGRDDVPREWAAAIERPEHRRLPEGARRDQPVAIPRRRVPYQNVLRSARRAAPRLRRSGGGPVRSTVYGVRGAAVARASTGGRCAGAA
jgi:anti-anti-sigma factor